MALYEKPSLEHLTTLFQVGFAARLRCEIANLFVRVDEGEADGQQASSDNSHAKALAITDNAKLATVFQFSSVSSSTTAANIQTPIIARGCSQYLTLSTSQPRVSNDPTLLRVTLERSPRTTRLLFSISSIGPATSRSFLSVKTDWGVKACGISKKSTKFEHFHLEIIPESIGSPFSQPPASTPSSATVDKFVYPSAALLHAILHCGTRFRLESAARSTLVGVDGRELVQTRERGTLYNRSRGSDSSGEESSKEVITFHAVPKESASETSKGSETARRYAFITETGGHGLSVLSITGQNKISLKGNARQTNESVSVNIDERYWDAIYIGSSRGAGSDSDTNESRTTHWLRADEYGGFDTRTHHRHHETFRLYFVAQSLRAQLSQLPVPSVVTRAQEATRAALRAQIESVCAEAGSTRSQGASSSQRRSPSSSSFNHAAALRGLSEGERATANGGPSNTGASASSPNGNSRNTRSSAAATTASANSSLPRNKKNRKAAKKVKKRMRTQSAQNRAYPPSSSGNRGNSSRNANGNASSSQNGATSGGTDRGGEQASSPAAAAASTSTSKQEAMSVTNSSAGPSGMGPPCGACGVRIAGSSVTALGKSFHPSCFVCGRCRKPLPPSFRHVKNVPYCPRCYADHVAPRCARCLKPIMETVIHAMDRTWHKECLTCAMCKLPLTQTFWLYANKPNEPRCSRCVTGDENYRSPSGAGNGNGNHRFVNLPGGNFNNNFGGMATPSTLSLGDLGSPTSSSSSTPTASPPLTPPSMSTVSSSPPLSPFSPSNR